VSHEGGHPHEAPLAVGFIFTIHFFNTRFRLDKFPMDPVILTGERAFKKCSASPRWRWG
jgi:hypothetical protein